MALDGVARRPLATVMMIASLAAASRDFNAGFPITSDGSANVSSFEELKQAVITGSSPILVTSERVVFPDRLVVRASTVTIESTAPAPATLDGGGVTQLFVLRNSTTLNLRSLQIAFGACEECFGGAIFVGPGSELRLMSVSLSSNRARDGGAIGGVGSTIIATDCTMDYNSAVGSGGAIYGGGNSTIRTSDCTLTSNSAHEGGAMNADDDSVVALTASTMAFNYAVVVGGAPNNKHVT